MFERPSFEHERAVLVHINFSDKRLDQEDLEEFKLLANAAGADNIAVITGSRQRPDAKYFIGSGKLEEIKEAAKLHEAGIVIFNHSLSPAQERNIERTIETRVLDRTGLILDIFAQRARTFEGKLQVELAQLEHLSTRLVRGWTHLERQKGGIGLRGPGETQLETDRRLLRGRIKQLKKRLAKVRAQREQSRQSRQAKPVPTIALVGYTNAGKSTLFNALTHSDAYVADKLFATLDPTLRRTVLPKVGDVVLADTVGFVRHLPHQLVDAFRATLEETQQADVLLHVIDISSENWRETRQEVETVLHEIGAGEQPIICIYNKIDRLEDRRAKVDAGETVSKAVWLSAQTGEGLDLLREALSDYLAQAYITRDIILTPSQSALRASLFELHCVQKEVIDKTGQFHLTICLSRKNFERLFPGEKS